MARAAPQTPRTEHRLRLMSDGVVESVHVSTVCRACRQLRLSSKKLCHYQARRDAGLSRTFVNERVVNDYEARMHLHVDETAKDGREFRRRGIAPLGAPACHLLSTAQWASLLEGLVPGLRRPGPGAAGARRRG